MTPTLSEVLHCNEIVRRMTLWQNPNNEKRPHLSSFCVAIALHLLFIGLGSFVFVKSAEYGIELNQSSVEVSLIAALPKEMQQGKTVPESAALEEKNDLTLPQTPAKGAEKSESPAERFETSKDEFSGDGSSSEAGKSKTTFYSAGGGAVEEKAGYLKNPAPAYPREAAERGQEGIVMLSVSVDRSGKPQKIEVRKSSGHSLLDEAALKTVKKWKFRPGRIGFLSAESELLIPIRFQLKDAKR